MWKERDDDAVSKKKILKTIRNAYERSDWTAYGKAVCDLFHLQPRDYAATLARERLIPTDVSTAIAEAIRATDTSDVAQLFDTLAIIDRRVNAILSRTQRLDVWTNPIASILQFSAFLEEQWSQLERTSVASVGSHLLAQALLADGIKLPDGTSASAGAIHEHAAEAFQVVLAHAQMVYGSRMNDMPGHVPDIEQHSFRELVALAQLWRGFEELRQEVIFLGWRARGDDDGTPTFEPADVAEYRRTLIGSHRRIEQLTVGAMMVLNNFASEVDDHKDVVNRVALSLRPPPPLEVWNGDVDRHAMRQMISLDITADSNDKNVLAFFYEPISRALTVGKAKVPWHLLNRIARGLRALADAFRERLKEADAVARVIQVEPVLLSRLLGDVCGVTSERALDALQALTFDSSSRELEIWDTPLLPGPNRNLILVPSLVLNGMSLRRLENFAAAEDRNLFDRRGSALENFVADVFRRQGISVQAPVRFGSAKVECDAVVWWDGWLILLEAKCTKSVFSAYDAFRGREVVEEAARQLHLRRDGILANWDAFRTAARDLTLPATAVSRDRIALVAVANVPHFTPQRIGDAVVTDDWCLQRFFSDPAVTLTSGNEEVGVLTYLRPEGPVTPKMLIEYLLSPPQFRLADAGLTIDLRFFPSADDQPPIAVTRSTYRPPLVAAALSRLQDRWPPAIDV